MKSWNELAKNSAGHVPYDDPDWVVAELGTMVAGIRE